MKIAFVNDCVERLGVEYLSAVLKNAGHDTNLFVDPQLFNDVYIHSNTLGKLFDFKEFLLLQIINYNPDLICFSVDTESYQWACNIAKLVKNNIDVPILFGGIHPSSIPERVISNDFIDIVFRHEFIQGDIYNFSGHIVADFYKISRIFYQLPVKFGNVN